MERQKPIPDMTVVESQQALGESVLTELELGLTFLDVAAQTTDSAHARRSVNNAILALRTADRFLAAIDRGSLDVEAIVQRRRHLAERLRAVTGVDEPT